MTTTITPKVDPLYGQQKAKRWPNIDFTRDGRHFPAPETAEAVAKANSDEWVYEANLQHDECVGNCGVATRNRRRQEKHLYWWPEYSHTLQLPAGKA
jgi:hypothetical protein